MGRGESSSTWNVATLSGPCFLHRRWKLGGCWCMGGLINNWILRSLLLHIRHFLPISSLCLTDISWASTKVLKCPNKHCINPFLHLIYPKGDVVMECCAWVVESMIVVIDTSASWTVWPRQYFLLVLLVTATACQGSLAGRWLLEGQHLSSKLKQEGVSWKNKPTN